MKLLLASFLYLASSSTEAHRLRKCDRDIDLVFVKDYYVSPPSFGPGHHVKLHIDLENNYMPINDGFIQYVLVYNNQEYYPQVDSLCSSITCPIHMGDNKITVPVEIPLYEEDIALRIELHNKNMSSFACMGLNLKTSLWSKLMSFITPAAEPIVNVPTRNLRGSMEVIEPTVTPRQDNATYNASFIEYLNKATPAPIPKPRQQQTNETAETNFNTRAAEPVALPVPKA